MSEKNEQNQPFDPQLYGAQLKAACSEAKRDRADPHAKIMLSECEPLLAVFLAAMEHYPDRAVEIVDATMQFAVFAILDNDLEPDGISQFRKVIYDRAKQAGLRFNFASV